MLSYEYIDLNENVAFGPILRSNGITIIACFEGVLELTINGGEPILLHKLPAGYPDRSKFYVLKPNDSVIVAGVENGSVAQLYVNN